jgi:hypothetical protein
MKRSKAEKLINDFLDNEIVITGETLLNFLEKELDMIRCPKMDLGEMGTLRVIEGWENETKRTKRKN